MLDFDSKPPFRQIIDRVRRKRELRAIQSTAFQAGAGLEGVDSNLMHLYATGRLHVSRIWALTLRLEVDDEFSRYARPHIEYAQAEALLTAREREDRCTELQERCARLPKTIRDRRKEASLVHSSILREIPVMDVDWSEEANHGWPVGDARDDELDQELARELDYPLDVWDSRDLVTEAYLYTIAAYRGGRLDGRQRRMVELRVMCDADFRERFGDRIVQKLERRLSARLSREARMLRHVRRLKDARM